MKNRFCNLYKFLTEAVFKNGHTCDKYQIHFLGPFKMRPSHLLIFCCAVSSKYLQRISLDKILDRNLTSFRFLRNLNFSFRFLRNLKNAATIDFVSNKKFLRFEIDQRSINCSKYKKSAIKMFTLVETGLHLIILSISWVQCELSLQKFQKGIMHAKFLKCIS